MSDEKHKIEHWSDCAIYNEPAYPAGPCDCGYDEETITDGVPLDYKLARGILKEYCHENELGAFTADAVSLPPEIMSAERFAEYWSGYKAFLEHTQGGQYPEDFKDTFTNALKQRDAAIMACNAPDVDLQGLIERLASALENAIGDSWDAPWYEKYCSLIDEARAAPKAPADWVADQLEKSKERLKDIPKGKLEAMQSFVERTSKAPADLTNGAE